MRHVPYIFNICYRPICFENISCYLSCCLILFFGLPLGHKCVDLVVFLSSLFVSCMPSAFVLPICIWLFHLRYSSTIVTMDFCVVSNWLFLWTYLWQIHEGKREELGEALCILWSLLVATCYFANSSPSSSLSTTSTKKRLNCGGALNVIHFFIMCL